MRSRVEKNGARAFSEAAGETIWIGLVAGSSVLFSLALACATPFAALATLAGSREPRRNGLVLVTAAWLVNQLAGYALLGYPRTWDSFAWGAAIGVAALLATLAAGAVAQRSGTGLPGILLAFLAAFAVYEAALFAATAVLPSGAEAFSPPVIGRIFAIDLLALAGLIALRHLATTIGLLASAPASPLAAHRI